MAQDKGELALAEVAKKKAGEIEADTLASRQLYEEELGLRESDEASDATYSSEEEYVAPPPPRPPRGPVVTSGKANRPLPPTPPAEETGGSESRRGVETSAVLHRPGYV